MKAASESKNDAKPLTKKKTVKFSDSVIDKNQIDADDLFSRANDDRSKYDARMTYGGTDAMM